MLMKSAGGKVMVDDHSSAVFTRQPRHKSEASEVFKVFKTAAENELGKTLREDQTCANSAWAK